MDKQEIDAIAARYEDDYPYADNFLNDVRALLEHAQAETCCLVQAKERCQNPPTFSLRHADDPHSWMHSCNEHLPMMATAVDRPDFVVCPYEPGGH